MHKFFDINPVFFFSVKKTRWRFLYILFFIMFWYLGFDAYSYDFFYFSFLNLLLKFICFLFYPSIQFYSVLFFFFFFIFVLLIFFFVNVFILFNLTLKFKICCCFWFISYCNFNIHYFLFWFFYDFNPHDFFIYSFFGLITWVIV